MIGACYKGLPLHLAIAADELVDYNTHEPLVPRFTVGLGAIISIVITDDYQRVHGALQGVQRPFSNDANTLEPIANRSDCDCPANAQCATFLAQQQGSTFIGVPGPISNGQLPIILQAFINVSVS